MDAYRLTVVQAGSEGSIWMQGSSARFGPLQADLRADVVVVGAGITGCIAAALASARGLDVVVLEAATVGSGTTGHTTGKLTTLHGLKYARLASKGGIAAARSYAGANQMGIDTILELIEKHRIACDLETDDAFTYATTPDLVSAIRAEVEAAVSAGIAAEFVTQCALPFPIEAAVRVQGQHHLHARMFCEGLTSAMTTQGVAIYEDSPATSVTQEEGRVVVVTEHGSVSAGHAVIATLSPIIDRVGLFARMTAERSYAMAVRLGGDAPKGMYINAEQQVRSLRPYPAHGTNLLIAAGENHQVGRESDTELRYAALESWVRDEFDVDSVEARWSAQDMMPFDLRPFVGSAGPGLDRVLVATGFQKWGLSNGAAAARMIVNEITGRPDPFIDFFRSTRIGLGTVTKDFVTKNVGTVSRLIGDKVRSITMSGPDSIIPGHGAVVKFGGETAAVYRDEDGAIHALHARCTHMGCFVAFNTAERTWDCPCHGSRFALDGTVIEGPATEPLAQMTDQGEPG